MEQLATLLFLGILYATVEFLVGRIDAADRVTHPLWLRAARLALTLAVVGAGTALDVAWMSAR